MALGSRPAYVMVNVDMNHNSLLLFGEIPLRMRPTGQLQRVQSSMSAELQEGSANAFVRLMRPQAASAPIILPTPVIIIDGSLEGSMTTDTCPDFSSAYIVKANSSSCPSQTNSVESHFVISKRVKRNNRTTLSSATCSFCGTLFAATNQTKMRIHLTGESEGQSRVSACVKVPLKLPWQLQQHYHCGRWR